MPAPENIRQGRLVAVSRDCMSVEFDDERCARCDGLCGLRGVGEGRLLDVSAVVDLPVGSRVLIGVPNRQLTFAALWLFGPPLLVLFAAPLVLRVFLPVASDAALAMTSVIGCVATALVGLRLSAARIRIQPRLVGVDEDPGSGATGSGHC